MYQLQSFAKNEKGRDFIVGDIHGMYDALMKLLESVNFDKNIDRLFSVGDLIDRGPKSLEVLYLNNQSWFFAVLGNHETMLLTGHLSYSKDWVTNLSKKQKEKCLDIIKTLPIAIEIETSLGPIGLVHAQVPTQFNDWNAFKHYLTAANLSYEMSSINDSGSVIRDALWGRKRIYRELKKNGTAFARKAYIKFIKDGLWNRTTLYRIITTRKTLPYIKHGISFSFRYIIEKFKRKLQPQSYIDNIAYTFHGHTPVKKPLLLGNQFFIDTGAVYGIKKNKQGSLTMIEICEDLKVHTLFIDQ
jgi:serine/threonine protein phosphatase 1